MHYHDSDDSKFMNDLRAQAPEMIGAFFDFDKAVFSKKVGNLDPATRELIAVAVAVTTQCPYCIETHVRKAKTEGAGGSDIAEAVMIAAALRAGGAVTHGWLAMKALQDD